MEIFLIDTVNYLMAMGTPPGKGQQSAPILVQLFPFFLLLVIFYFILIRPQQKKAKDHAAMLKTLRSGDKVTTNGGMVGVIVAVKDRTVSLRSADSKVELLKSSIGEIVERSSESDAS